jgi:hypothetical protein
MTRLERAHAKLLKEREKIAAIERQGKERVAQRRTKVRQAEALARDAARQATEKRRYHVGHLADQAGLFAWSDSDIAAVFALLGMMETTTNPAVVLEGLLSDTEVETYATLATESARV